LQQSQEAQSETPVPITVMVYPSDPRFPRDQLEAARYYLSPSYRVIPGETGEKRERPKHEPPREQVTFEVHCLAAESVRKGENVPIDPELKTGPPDEPEKKFYGLIVRRVSGQPRDEPIPERK
jgi:hypothetical protein